jgi:hypothetical protein
MNVQTRPKSFVNVHVIYYWKFKKIEKLILLTFNLKLKKKSIALYLGINKRS